MKFLNSKLELFLAKRASVLFVILALLDVIFVRQRWVVLAGLALGGILSLIRLGSTSAVFSKLLSPDRKQAAAFQIIIRYAVNQAFTIILLALSLMFSLWFFAGVTAGILLVPFIIMINGITEGLGITCNNFE